TIIEQPRDVSVTVAPEVAAIEVGGTVQLVAVVHNSENQNVTWASAASNIATVSTSGLVTGVAPGTAVITATSAADPTKKATATIEVKAPDPGAPVEVTIVPSEVSDLMVGETVQLVAVVKNASNQAVTWSSPAEAIATVSASGLVTAVAPGMAVITATSVADPTKKAAASIRVNAPPPLVLTLTPESAEIKPGETLQLVATVSDGSAVTFSSSAENVATVDESGLVTGVAPGTAVITAAAVADPTVRKTAAITVVAPVEPTVQIKSITQGDLTTPVNPNNVSGQMAITLNVDAPAGSGVSAVQLFIDDVLAGEQTF